MKIAAICIFAGLTLTTGVPSATSLTKPRTPFYLEGPQASQTFEWEVRIDGTRVPLRNISLDQNDLQIDLEEFMDALTGNRSSVKNSQGRYIVSIDGTPRISLPMAPGTATLTFGDAKLGQIRKEPFGDEVRKEKIGPAQKLAPVTALEELCALLGLSLSSSGRYIDIFTPALWWSELGGKGDRVKRILDNLRLTPEFGVSPPSDVSMFWVRPPENGWVQVFELRRSGPESLLSAEEDGSALPNVGNDIRTPMLKASELVRFTHRTPERTDFVTLVAVISKVKPPDGDMLQAIRDGNLTGSQVCVVGVRQERRAMALKFGIADLKAESKVGELADRWQMDIELFQFFNGLTDKERTLPKGSQVFYLDPTRLDDNAEALIDGNLKGTEIQGYYLVRTGETVETIASRLKVSVDLLYDLNQDVLSPGVPIAGGTVIVLPEKAQVPAPEQKDVLRPQKGEFRATIATSLYANPDESSASSPLKAGTPLNYSAVMSGGKWLQVESRFGTRYVLASSGKTQAETVEFVRANPVSPGATVVPKGVSPKAGQLVSVGLQFLNTPYRWGGNDLRRGIDCSHYVSAIFRRVGVKVSPPVHNMETTGQIVWAYGGVFHRGNKVFSGGPTGTRNPQVGDRFIYQSNPGATETGRRTNGHHVAFYAGSFMYLGKPYHNKILEAAGRAVKHSNADTANRKRLRLVLRDTALY